MRITDCLQSLSPKQRAAVPYLLLAAAVFAAYANVYNNTFVLDDIPLIVQNGFLRSWGSLPDLLSHLSNGGAGRAGGFCRPLQMLLYFFIYQSFGLQAAAFHLLNVALQAANAGLVYRLGCRLGLRAGAAFLAALLWAVHPLFTESVTYMSGTADPLYSFFSLLGILVLLPDFTPRKFWLSGLLFALALGAKESAIVFPALAAITLFLVSKERLHFSTYLRTWPLWLLAAVYIGGWLMFMHASGYNTYDPRDMIDPQLYAGNIANRIFTALATLPVYAGLIVWPAGLHMERSYPVFTSFWSWRVLPGAAMAAGVILQIFWGRARRGLALSWGLLWFAAAHAPNTGILIPVNALVAEHWMYLPTVGLFLGVAVWLEDLKIKKLQAAAAALAVAATLSFGVKTYLQNRVWRDPGAFYENILLRGESSGRIHNNLGLFYWSRGEFEKAAGQLRLAVADPGLRMQPMIVGMHTNLALMYLRAHVNEAGTVTLQELQRALPLAPQTPEAIAELEAALEIDPAFFWANQILYMIYDDQGNKKKAAFYKSRLH